MYNAKADYGFKHLGYVMKKIISVIVAGIILIWLFSSNEVELGAGVYAPGEPIQETITQPVTFDYQGFKVTPLASFDIMAKVILREDYHYDEGAEISPMDLALGWGRMSDEAVLKHINFSQSGRWYRYRYESAPIPQKEIETHSANMHMIPAETWIEDHTYFYEHTCYAFSIFILIFLATWYTSIHIRCHY